MKAINSFSDDTETTLDLTLLLSSIQAWCKCCPSSVYRCGPIKGAFTVIESLSTPKLVIDFFNLATCLPSIFLFIVSIGIYLK